MVSAPLGEQVVYCRTARGLDLAQRKEQATFGKRCRDTHFIDSERRVAKLTDRLADPVGIERTGAGDLQARIAGASSGAPIAVTQGDPQRRAKLAGDSNRDRYRSCGVARIE